MMAITTTKKIVIRKRGISILVRKKRSKNRMEVRDNGKNGQ
jgi:hypothetical protein